MILQPFRKAYVIQDQSGSRTLCLELKLRDGIRTLGPGDDAPGLDNSLVGHQLDVPPHDVPAETREVPTGFATDLGRKAGESPEPLPSHTPFTNPFPTPL